MTEPTYFGTPNEPYESPPDRPYESPPDRPYQSPPDRPYESPPDRPYELPPDQPYQPTLVQPPPDRPDESPPAPSYQPPPVQQYQPPPIEPPPDHAPPDQPPPEKRRRLRRLLTIGGAVLVVIACAFPEEISFLDNSSDSGKSSDPAYGRKPVDVVHELHICDNPTVDQALGFATCTFQDGIGYAIVATVANKTEQGDLAADDKDPAEGCTMVVKGYFVTGPDRATLTQALGNLDAFAANHHGYLVGGCS